MHLIYCTLELSHSIYCIFKQLAITFILYQQNYYENQCDQICWSQYYSEWEKFWKLFLGIRKTSKVGFTCNTMKKREMDLLVGLILIFLSNTEKF